MPDFSGSLFEKVVTELFYDSFLPVVAVKKFSEESAAFQACFVLAVVAVPIAVIVVFSVIRCRRKEESKERLEFTSLWRIRKLAFPFKKLHSASTHAHHQGRSNGPATKKRFQVYPVYQH